MELIAFGIIASSIIGFTSLSFGCALVNFDELPQPANDELASYDERNAA